MALLVVMTGTAAPTYADAERAKHLPAKVVRDPALSDDGMGRMEYTLGQSIFERIWVSAPSSTEAADGLGPLFNARSCVACHPAGARSLALQGAQGITPSLLVRLGFADGRPDPVYGYQLQTEAVASVPAEGRVTIDFETHDVMLADGTHVTLRRPVATIDKLGYGPLERAILTGLRIGPALHGIGPLGSIADNVILAGADPEDADGDGVSGRPAWLDAEKTRLGRFGWKAVQPDMAAQNANAFMADLGLSTELFMDPQGECTGSQEACRNAPSGASPQYANLEVSPLLMSVLDRFVAEAVLPPHQPYTHVDRSIGERGRDVFASAGCLACHRESYDVTWPAGAAQTRRISPYTDLLLHDLGDGLAEALPEGMAVGSEWRTAPLWGLRWALDGKGEGALLHDGRARTLLEAILWHGGEAQKARDNVASLPADDRTALIAFLSTL